MIIKQEDFIRKLIRKKLNNLNEGFLISQDYIHKISNEIVNKLNLSDIIDSIMDDIENVDKIEIFLNDYEINCGQIFGKWAQKDNVDDEFSNFMADIYTKVIFTNNLPKNVYGNLTYYIDASIIKINYNHPEANDLIYKNIRKIEKDYGFQLSKEEIHKLIKKYLIPRYIYSVAHELRHLYDDYRSNNKIDKVYVDGYGIEYLLQTPEIWARFTELLSYIKRNKIKFKDFDFNLSYQYLLNNFKGFESLSKKTRSKLTSYLYRYINKQFF